MVDAVVQVGSARARIRCQDVVASLTACLDLVALQLPRRIVVYRATPGCAVCCLTHCQWQLTALLWYLVADDAACTLSVGG